MIPVCAELARRTVIPRELSPHPLGVCSLSLVPFSASPSSSPVSLLVPGKHCESLFLWGKFDDDFLFFTWSSVSAFLHFSSVFPGSASVQGLVKLLLEFPVLPFCV